MTAVTLAAIVMTTPILKQVSANPRFTLRVSSNANPHWSQEPRLLLIFLH
jgi:hypothetical protein